jgi:hypothetical protein
MQGAIVVTVPMLTGCQPCSYSAQGQTVQPLQAETDKGFQLINALDPGQQQQTILSHSVTDLVLGPGHDGEVLAPEGIPASSLNADQKARLVDLAGEWVNVAADPAASQKIADIKAHLAETYFAWSAATVVVRVEAMPPAEPCSPFNRRRRPLSRICRHCQPS